MRGDRVSREGRRCRGREVQGGGRASSVSVRSSRLPVLAFPCRQVSTRSCRYAKRSGHGAQGSQRRHSLHQVVGQETSVAAAVDEQRHGLEAVGVGPGLAGASGIRRPLGCIRVRDDPHMAVARTFGLVVTGMARSDIQIARFAEQPILLQPAGRCSCWRGRKGPDDCFLARTALSARGPEGRQPLQSRLTARFTSWLPLLMLTGLRALRSDLGVDDHWNTHGPPVIGDRVLASFALYANDPLGELAGSDRLRFAPGRPDRHPSHPPRPKPGRSTANRCAGRVRALGS